MTIFCWHFFSLSLIFLNQELNKTSLKTWQIKIPWAALLMFWKLIIYLMLKAFLLQYEAAFSLRAKIGNFNCWIEKIIWKKRTLYIQKAAQIHYRVTYLAVLLYHTLSYEQPQKSYFLELWGFFHLFCCRFQAELSFGLPTTVSYL